MKRKTVNIFLCFCLLLTLLPQTASAEDAAHMYIYVSPTGNDAADGTITAPLKTLQAARDAVRRRKKSGELPERGFVVYLRGGDYMIQEGLELMAEDSGTEAAPVVYRAYPGETVTLVGGASLPGSAFTRVTDESILNRIVDESARKQVVVADLGVLGFTDFGEVFWPGAYSYAMHWLTKPKAASPELFINGSLQTNARYPNEGYMQIAEVIDPGANPRMWENDKKSEPGYVKEADRDQEDTFEIRPDDERYKKWMQVPENDALMYGFWAWAWADHTVPLKKVYPDANKLESGVPSWYSVKTGGRFYVFNLLEEIDMPGEYYLDCAGRKLYLYPPVDLNGADIKLSVLQDPLIHIKGADYVTIKGIKMTAARNMAVYMESGTHNIVRECEISYTADTAVTIDSDCKNSGVIGCTIHDVNGGVRLRGGDAKTLTSAENFAVNNEIYRFARINKTYNPAVGLEGVGNIAAYNEMYDAVHLAIQFSGNNHKIHYNNIHDVVTENDDMGAIYSGRSWVQRGTSIRYNYIHNLHSSLQKDHGIHGIYLDDRLCEVDMSGNIFEDIDGSAIMINGGRDNVVFNNLLVNVSGGFLFRDILPPDPESDTTNLMASLQTAPYQSEIWAKAYPHLPNILDDQPGYPKYNMVRNNVSINCGKSSISKAFSDGADMENNYESMTADFYDAENKNYLLKADSAVFKAIPDFVQLPVTRMGTYTKRAEERVRQAAVLAIGSPMTLAEGELVQIDADNSAVIPKIIGDRTFVPLRYISEHLGMTVQFDETNGQITVSDAESTLTLAAGDETAQKNGSPVAMGAAAFIEEGRTMVPLRAVSEMLSKEVFWDDCGLIVVSEHENILNPKADAQLIDTLYQTLSVH